MNEFLTFRHMITPTLIQVVYWILIVVVAFVSLSAFSVHPLLPFATLIVGILLVRVGAEIPMLAFRVNETLAEIKDMTEERIGAAALGTQNRMKVGIGDFLVFRRMITPSLVALLFVIYGLGLILAFVAAFVSPSEFGLDPNIFVAIFFGIAIFGGIGYLYLRIIAEFLVVMFRINERFTDIRNLTIQRTADSTSTAYSSTSGKIGDFLAFRRMVAPIFIQVGYWLYVVTIGILALNIVTDSTGFLTNPLLRFVAGLLILIGGLLIVRVVAEANLLPFRINGTVTDIRNVTVQAAGGTVGSAYGSGIKMSDFLVFRRMISPIII